MARPVLPKSTPLPEPGRRRVSARGAKASPKSSPAAKAEPKCKAKAKAKAKARA